VQLTVNLEIANTVVLYKIVDDMVHSFDHSRMTIVKLVSALFNHPHSVLLEVSLGGQLISDRTFDAHDFRLKPDAWFHASRCNMCDELFKPRRKPRSGGKPFAYSVPPISSKLLGIPARVDDKVFGTAEERWSDQSFDLVFCWITPTRGLASDQSNYLILLT
jgi:hypothetical protein